LLEKAAKLPSYNISLAAKEIELRALVSNWTLSLGSDEQKRIIGELLARLNDYLRDNYRDFERTGFLKADISTFEFVSINDIAGRIAHVSFIDEDEGDLRVATVSGRGAAQKMIWLVTGAADYSIKEKPISGMYVLDGGMKIIGAAEDLDLPARACAVRFEQKTAWISTCRQGDPLYIIGLMPPEVDRTGELKLTDASSYLYPFEGEFLLTASKDARKIKMSFFDVALAYAPDEKSSYNLNDYWVDMDGNYQAFSVDEQAGLFFLPAAKGGRIFSYEHGQIKLEKTLGDFAPVRSFFSSGDLYLIGDNAVEVFGAADWNKIKSINL
jgi:uncharacterized secreted protein with C-terminal beta-propeller domain